MDVATAVCGSSPAFFSMFLEAVGGGGAGSGAGEGGGDVGGGGDGGVGECGEDAGEDGGAEGAAAEDGEVLRGHDGIVVVGLLVVEGGWFRYGDAGGG